MPSSKTVSRQDVLHMATLSRLTVDDADVDRYAAQMSDILSYMDILEKIDTSAVEPLYSPSEHGPLMRPDEAAHRRTREEILANAPERTDEYFVVPRIV